MTIQSTNDQFTLWIELSHAIRVTFDMTVIAWHNRWKEKLLQRYILFVNYSVSIIRMPAF